MAKTDTHKCEITSKGDKVITVRTARGRLAYPRFFTPNEDSKYASSLVFPKAADLTELKEAIELAAKIKFGPDFAKKYPGLKRPILETAKSPAMGADPEAFPFFIRTSTKAAPDRPKPRVVNHAMEPIDQSSEGEVYPGRWAMLTIAVGAYDTDGNRGVTCYLNNAQLLEHDARLGGGSRAASDDFEAVPVSGDASDMFKE